MFLKIVIWITFLSALIVPTALAAMSPYLAYRSWVYIVAGFAGVIAMTLLLVQPVLAGGHLPAVPAVRQRRLHRFAGMLLLMLVLVHIGGLWLTSPPDVIDVLLFRSPTPFSVWGMVALLALLATALVTGLRKKLRLPYPQWRFIHLGLATLLVTGCIVHALKIEGTMETISKTALAAAIVVMLVRLIVGSKSAP